MPTMCAIAAQGWVPQGISAAINECSDYVELEKKVLDSTRSFSEVLVDIGVLDEKTDRKVIEHINMHWLGDDRHAWWPFHRNKSSVLKQGLGRLVREAGTRKLPAAIYWMCTAPHFQCIISASKAQVTGFIMTPPIPAATDQPASTVPEDMWVIGGRREVDAIVSTAELYGGRPTTSDCVELDAKDDIWETQVFSEAR